MENGASIESNPGDRANKRIKLVITFLAIIWSLFQIGVAVYPVATNSLLAIHLSFGLALGFLINPLKKKSDLREKKQSIFFDLMLAFLSIVPGIYICLFQEDIMMRMGRITTPELILGIILILLILELGRRLMGWAIVIVALLAICYTYFGNIIPGILGHRGFNINRIVNQLYLTNEGIYTIPIGVSAAFVYLFILFGVFLQSCGGGDFFIKLATALLGRFRGGPAKIAVLSSCLFGMISGSAVANVVVTGSFTIPLMKRTGFRPYIAGAVEAAASSGGQFMPPIMGAAAFIIPDMIGSTYFDVAKAAFFPGLLYFLAIFFMVDFEAIKMNLSGLPKKDLPSASAAVKESGHLLLPVLVLIYLLAVVRTSPTLAAFWSVISVVITSMLRKSTRMNLGKILSALEEGAYAAIIVVSACALGGIIIGCMMLTGLGMSLSTILVDFSHGSLILLLLLTMIASLILGMGMTTTACYIILAILVGPALIKMGVDPMAAHLFIFYFGIISAITPPVAVAAYAGAGLAGSDPMKTGYAAWRLGLSAFILPFMFVYGPALLLKGSLGMLLITMVASTLGIYALSAAIQNYMFGNLSFAKRIVLCIAAILLIFPGVITDIIGFFLLLSVFLVQKSSKVKSIISKTAAFEKT